MNPANFSKSLQVGGLGGLITLLALSAPAAPGDLMIEVKHERELGSAAAVLPNGNLCTRFGNGIAVFSPHGKLIWELQNDGGQTLVVGNDPMVDAAGHIYTFAKNSVFCHASGGGLLWRAHANDNPYTGTCVTPDGRIFRTFRNPGSYRVKLWSGMENGLRLWTASALPYAVAGSNGNGNLYTSDGVVTADFSEVVFGENPVSNHHALLACSGDGAYFLDGSTIIHYRSDGVILAEYVLGEGVDCWGMCVDEKERIYVSSRQAVFSFEMNGALRWHLPMEAEERSLPTVSRGGTCYLPSGRNQLLAIDADSGEILWTNPLRDQNPLTLTVGDNGRVYALLFDGTFRAYEGDGTGVSPAAWGTYRGGNLRGNSLPWEPEKVPDPPSHVTASTEDASTVKISWDPVAASSHYEIWRSSFEPDDEIPLHSAVIHTNYHDVTALPGTDYHYVVRAVNPKGPGAFSAPAVGRRPETTGNDELAFRMELRATPVVLPPPMHSDGSMNLVLNDARILGINPDRGFAFETRLPDPADTWVQFASVINNDGDFVVGYTITKSKEHGVLAYYDHSGNLLNRIQFETSFHNNYAVYADGSLALIFGDPYSGNPKPNTMRRVQPDGTIRWSRAGRFRGNLQIRQDVSGEDFLLHHFYEEDLSWIDEEGRFIRSSPLFANQMYFGPDNSIVAITGEMVVFNPDESIRWQSASLNAKPQFWLPGEVAFDPIRQPLVFLDLETGEERSVYSPPIAEVIGRYVWAGTEGFFGKASGAAALWSPTSGILRERSIETPYDNDPQIWVTPDGSLATLSYAGILPGYTLSLYDLALQAPGGVLVEDPGLRHHSVETELPAPPIPTKVEIDTESSPRYLEISWQGNQQATGYRLWRSETPSIDSAVLIRDTITGPHRIRDYSLESGIQYFYWLQSFNGSGKSGFSEIVSGTPLPLEVGAKLDTLSLPASTGYPMAMDATGNIYIAYEYVSNLDAGGVECLALDGTRKWLFTSPGVAGAVSLSASGQVYFEDQQGILHAVDADFGEEIWAWENMPQYRAGPPAINTDDTLIATDRINPGKSLVVKLSDSGQLLWSLPLPLQMVESPVIGVSGTIYVMDTMGDVHAVDQEGNLLWSSPANFVQENLSGRLALGADETLWAYGRSAAPDLIRIAADGFRRNFDFENFNAQTSPLVPGDGNILISNGYHSMYSLSFDGGINWKLNFEHRFTPVALAGNRFMVATESGGLVILNSAGEVLQEIAGEGQASGEPVVSDEGFAYVPVDERLDVYYVGPPDREAPWPQTYHDARHSNRLQGNLTVTDQPPIIHPQESVLHDRIEVAWDAGGGVSTFRLLWNTMNDLESAVAVPAPIQGVRTWTMDHGPIAVPIHVWIQAITVDERIMTSEPVEFLRRPVKPGDLLNMVVFPEENPAAELFHFVVKPDDTVVLPEPSQLLGFDKELKLRNIIPLPGPQVSPSLILPDGRLAVAVTGTDGETQMAVYPADFHSGPPEMIPLGGNAGMVILALGLDGDILLAARHKNGEGSSIYRIDAEGNLENLAMLQDLHYLSGLFVDGAGNLFLGGNNASNYRLDARGEVFATYPAFENTFARMFFGNGWVGIIQNTSVGFHHPATGRVQAQDDNLVSLSTRMAAGLNGELQLVRGSWWKIGVAGRSSDFLRDLGASLSSNGLLLESGDTLWGIEGGEVVSLNPQGREVWKSEINSSPYPDAVSHLQILSDGTLVALTERQLVTLYNTTPPATHVVQYPYGNSAGHHRIPRRAEFTLDANPPANNQWQIQGSVKVIAFEERIRSVGFFLDGILVGEDREAPFEFATPTPIKGHHEIKALVQLEKIDGSTIPGGLYGAFDTMELHRDLFLYSPEVRIIPAGKDLLLTGNLEGQIHTTVWWSTDLANWQEFQHEELSNPEGFSIQLPGWAETRKSLYLRITLEDSPTEVQW